MRNQVSIDPATAAAKTGWSPPSRKVPKIAPAKSNTGPTLFVFTSDGDNREDGLVHYASYLLVDANRDGDPKRWQRVVAIINAAMDDDDEGWQDPRVIRHDLKSAGIRATLFSGDSLQMVYNDTYLRD